MTTCSVAMDRPGGLTRHGSKWEGLLLVWRPHHCRHRPVHPGKDNPAVWSVMRVAAAGGMSCAGSFTDGGGVDCKPALGWPSFALHASSCQRAAVAAQSVLIGLACWVTWRPGSDVRSTSLKASTWNGSIWLCGLLVRGEVPALTEGVA